jgi:hypothetical protein
MFIIQKKSHSVNVLFENLEDQNDNFNFEIIKFSSSIFSNECKRRFGVNFSKDQTPQDIMFFVIPSEKLDINKIMVRVFCIVKFTAKDGKEYRLLYYTSSGSGGKNIENKWYPVFGIYDDGDMRWIIKTNGKDMENKINGKSAPYGIRELGIIKDFLDLKYDPKMFESYWKKYVVFGCKVQKIIIENLNKIYTDEELKKSGITNIFEADKKFFPFDKLINDKTNAFFCLDNKYGPWNKKYYVSGDFNELLIDIAYNFLKIETEKYFKGTIYDKSSKCAKDRINFIKSKL